MKGKYRDCSSRQEMRDPSASVVVLVLLILRFGLLKETVLPLSARVLADEHGAVRVVDDVVADAAEQGATELALPARPDHNHVDALLLGDLAQRVARLESALVPDVDMVNLKQRQLSIQCTVNFLSNYVP